MLLGRLRGPPSLRVRSQRSASRRIPSVTPSSLRSSQASKAGRRSSSSRPARRRTSATCPAHRCRARSEGSARDHATSWPSWRPSSAAASPRRTRRRISPDHPRASARRSATRTAAARDGLARRAPARAGVRRGQFRLNPGGSGGEGPARAARRGSRAWCHPVEEQLVMAGLHAGRGQGGHRRGRGPFPGTAAGQLDPAQPAVPVLHPQCPAAPGALALVPVAVAERAAGPAPYLLHHSPGQAVGAAAGLVAGRVPGPAHLRAAAGTGRRGAWA